ncbi:MAG: 23S rRNA (pseudouridine(1915)-N(3))-methyltransferase RlmH [Candidatus Tumulicola sp.]
MLIRIVAVDRVRSPHVAAVCADLRTRIAPYHPYAEVEVRPGDGKDPRAAMRDESTRILRHLRADDRMWLLERTGSQLSSPALAGRLDEAGRSGARRLTLVIAGTYGADAALRMRAEFLWSLSELTFLHEWSRAIVLEQLYRAAKIARNEPYHH